MIFKLINYVKHAINNEIVVVVVKFKPTEETVTESEKSCIKNM